MSEFGKFAEAVKARFNELAKNDLYLVEIPRDELWEIYMRSFPAGTNKMFRVRREYECQTCRQFIKNIAGVVAIDKDLNLRTIWEVEAEGYYNDVAKNMHKAITASIIAQPLLYSESKFGAPTTVDSRNGEKWNHFNCVLPSRFVATETGSRISEIRGTVQVYSRGLKELTLEALDTTLELISQGSLYRADEFKATIQDFKKLKVSFDKVPEALRLNFVYSTYKEKGSRIRNTAIGTLLQDLSEGRDLESAVKAFEAVVAPTNYKRPNALITQGMINSALEKIKELGIEGALHRRHAKLEDISVADVLFVDRSAAKVMKGSLEGLLQSEVKVNPKKLQELQKVEEIGIEKFLTDVLPTCTSLEVLLENKHEANLCNLIAPVDADLQSVLKWNNNFTWSYNGNITDAMKQNVKNAGGNVEGVLRFSIQWNDGVSNQNDLDAHCIEPNGYALYFANRGSMSPAGGNLDVDITNPGSKVAVENIIYTNPNRLKEGTYKFFVHNYRGTNGRDFTAQIEFDGVIHTFNYTGLCRTTMNVAEVTYKNGKFSIKTLMDSSEGSAPSKKMYNLDTQLFHKVDLVTLSPNFWNDQEIGNKHYMFMLKDCLNPDSTRGFYNEFLSNGLNEHRKVFEVLGSKMQCEYSDQQCAGLGFSSTQRAELVVKVQGEFQRTLKIKF